jgi:hypothetical protein
MKNYVLYSPVIIAGTVLVMVCIMSLWLWWTERAERAYARRPHRKKR